MVRNCCHGDRACFGRGLGRNVCLLHVAVIDQLTDINYQLELTMFGSELGFTRIGSI